MFSRCMEEVKDKMIDHAIVDRFYEMKEYQIMKENQVRRFSLEVGHSTDTPAPAKSYLSK